MEPFIHPLIDLKEVTEKRYKENPNEENKDRYEEVMKSVKLHEEYLKKIKEILGMEPTEIKIVDGKELYKTVDELFADCLSAIIKCEDKIKSGVLSKEEGKELINGIHWVYGLIDAALPTNIEQIK